MLSQRGSSRAVAVARRQSNQIALHFVRDIFIKKKAQELSRLDNICKSLDADGQRDGAVFLFLTKSRIFWNEHKLLRSR